VDEALAARGLERRVAVVVPSFRAALSIAAATDLVALVPSTFFRPELAHGALRAIPLPVPTDPITVSQMWHPRQDKDPGHQWLRGLVFELCRSLAPT
jgi:DNA-binding transcriptional LysR family regulator